MGVLIESKGVGRSVGVEQWVLREVTKTIWSANENVLRTTTAS